ncbi:MAG: hypothetical protein ACPLW9_01390 [Minisyncoccales bacterium]
MIFKGGKIIRNVEWAGSVSIQSWRVETDAGPFVVIAGCGNIAKLSQPVQSSSPPPSTPPQVQVIVVVMESPASPQPPGSWVATWSQPRDYWYPYYSYSYEYQYRRGFSSYSRPPSGQTRGSSPAGVTVPARGRPPSGVTVAPRGGAPGGNTGGGQGPSVRTR